jgi:hypothetical protein
VRNATVDGANCAVRVEFEATESAVACAGSMERRPFEGRELRAAAFAPTDDAAADAWLATVVAEVSDDAAARADVAARPNRSEETRHDDVPRRGGGRTCVARGGVSAAEAAAAATGGAEGGEEPKKPGDESLVGDEVVLIANVCTAEQVTITNSHESTSHHSVGCVDAPAKWGDAIAARSLPSRPLELSRLKRSLSQTVTRARHTTTLSVCGHAPAKWGDAIAARFAIVRTRFALSVFFDAPASGAACHAIASASRLFSCSF